ncbi:MAG: YitT family protein [Clostridium sp.]|uniref:YitT family protein n=1 Tax=Clostridium sp. TaxID=1506 RepID=UPI002A84D6EF|nr:YitT family protein [Clostridium sp.]MDY5099150.1 YitT family protein [Clostridium sp.]
MNKKFKEYLTMTLGMLMVAISVEFFVIPNNMASGGITGFSVVANNYIPALSVEALTFIFNIILFITGFLFIGGSFGVKTLYGALGISGLMWFIKTVFNPQAITNDLMINAIFASALTGTGLALVFSQDASTGGTDIIAKILNKYLKLDMGKSMQVVDMIVVVLGGLTFGWEKGMYSLVIVFMNGFIIDKVIAGFNNCKELLIMSSKNDEIKTFIMNDVNRGCTIIPAKGAYSGQETDMIYCVVNRKQFIDIKKFIREIDQDAFITVSEAHEVLGKGFNSL